MNLARKYSNARDYWEDRVENNRQYDLKKQAIESRDAKNLQKTKNKSTLKATEMRQQAATKRTGMQQKGSTKRTGMRQKSAMTQHEDQMAMKKKKNRQAMLKELMGGQTDQDGYTIQGTRMPYNKALKVWKFRQRAMEEKMGQGQLQDSDDQDNFRTWTDDQGVKHFSNLKPGASQGAMQRTGVSGNKSNVFKEDRNLNKSKPGFGLDTKQTALPSETGGLQSLTKRGAKEKEFVEERASGSDREKGTLGTIRGGRTVYLNNGRVMVRRPNGKVGPATEEDLKELEYLQ